MKRTIVLVFCLALEVPLGPRAQKSVVPPPTAADSGPSLEVTMEFLEQKLNQQEPLMYTVTIDSATPGYSYVYPAIPPENYPQSLIQSVNAQTSRCTLAYELRYLSFATYMDFHRPPQETVVPISMNLGDVEDILVQAAESDRQLKSDMSYRSKDGLVAAVTALPGIEILVRSHGNKKARLLFSEPEMPERYAKALKHAVELCGGGDKDPF